MQKTLYILRHAKAEPAGPQMDDKARPLSMRGTREAMKMGWHLSGLKVWPVKVICSTAERTRQTLIAMQTSYRQKMPVEFLDRLYMATPSDIMALLAEQPGNLQKVMLIGHNPGLHELSVRLVREGNDDLIRQLTTDLPTCGFVEISFNGPWKLRQGKLERFVVPATL